MISLKVLKAFGELMIVKQKVEKITASGITLPDSALRMGSMESFEGEILAVGSKTKHYKKGDWVLFGRNVFASLNRYNKEYLLMFEKDVCCMENDVDDNYVAEDSEFVIPEE